MKKKELVCECGCKKFQRSMDMMDNVVLTCNPPIHVSVYICKKCQKRHTIHKQDFPPQESYHKADVKRIIEKELTEYEQLKGDVQRYFELMDSDDWTSGEVENLREDIILKVKP